MSRLTSGASRLVRRAFGRPEPTTPCLGCGPTVGVRQFSIDPGPPVDPMGDDVTPRLAPGVAFVVVDGQVVLYDRGRLQSHVLNPSAALIWAEVDDQRTVAGIVDDLTRDTGADRGLIDHDVKATLTRMLETHVVEVPPDDRFDAVEPVDQSGDGPDEGRDGWVEPSPPDLDAVDWVASFGPLDVLGTPLVVRTNEPDLAAELGPALAALPPVGDGDGAGSGVATVLSLVDLGPDDPPRFRVYLDGHRRWSDEEDAILVPAALDEITRMAIDGRPGHVMLHAGAVERDGQVVVVAGDSGQGKSTLTAALVQQGFRYLTDEVVVVDPATLAVSPFAKAIDLDGRARELLGLPPDGRRRDRVTAKSPVPVAAVGEVSTGGRLALVVMLMGPTDPLDAASTPQSEAIRSMLDLIGCTFGPTFDDDGALEWLAHLAVTVAVLHLPRSPLDEATARITELLEGAER